MNVAFVGNFREEAVNGVVNSANSLAKGLESHGVKVFFYGVSEKTVFYSVGNFVYRKFRKSKIPMMICKEFHKLLSENSDQIDVFHFHSVFIPFFIPIQKCLISHGYPYVLTPHGGYDRNVLSKNKFLKNIYIKLFEKNLIKNANRVICVHENEIGDVLNIASSAKTEVIFNPVELKETSYTTYESSNIKILVYLGRFDILHKGLDKLLFIFKIIEKKDPSVHLKLYGQGRDRGKLESLIEKLGLHNVKICAPVYGAEKSEVLHKATAYVQLSNWEAFGMSIVEAMLMAKPVILSSNCALSSLLMKAKAGLVVDNTAIEKAAEEILGYLNFPSKIGNDGIVLKKMAESEFSVATIANKTSDLYLTLCKEKVNS